MNRNYSLKARTLIVLLTIFSILSPAFSVSARHENNKKTNSSLSNEQMKNAIVISDLNDRHVLVKDGQDIIYRIKDTDTYIQIENKSSKFLPESGLSTLNAGHASPASFQTWQQCGVNVYVLGGWVAGLSNRAMVYYRGDTAIAPAQFLAYDMSGTNTIPFFTWNGLSQSSVPAKNITFNSGYVQANGTLQGCIEGICRTYGVFTSYLMVNTSGTYCQ
jgi:hypothetical protein